MKPGTIPRVELARRITDLPPYRIGQWVLAGTPTTEPYPCTCRYDPCRYLKCPDRYRTEGDALPPACCGRAGHTREADAGRLVAEAARKAPGFVQPDRRTTWERRLPTAPGVSVAEVGLWDTGAEEPPPAWDAIDEVSGSHGETLEDAFGHLETLDPFEAAGEDAEERWRTENAQRRAGVAAGHCECPTPWDTDPPALLWAASAKATAPEQVQPLSAKPGADARADADALIELVGDRRVKPWKDARHALLPPPADAKVKTRACWLAPLASGRVAVIDIPPEPRGGGVHCPDCHISLASAGAYQIHRPTSPGRPAGVCRDPRTILTVRHGSPLLKRRLDGVWEIDRLAPWGPDGPPVPTVGWA